MYLVSVSLCPCKYYNVCNNISIHPVAVIMKDFTFLHDGIPKQLGNGLFNFKKLRDIVDKVSNLVYLEFVSSYHYVVVLFSLRS